MPQGPTGGRETLNRASVIDAARRQIIDHGADAVSLRRVASSLGVTAPALYAYVESKSDLLRAVVEHELDRLIQRFDTVDEPDPIQRMRQLARAYLDYAVENPELFKTIFLFPPELTITEATGDELPLATKAINYAAEAVTDAIAQGAFRNDLDPLLLTFTAWTATHGLADVLLLGFAFDDATTETLIDLVLDTVIAGLRVGAPGTI